MYVGRIPVPPISESQEVLVEVVVEAILSGAKPLALFESLLNAFVYELFFSRELAERNLSPFAEAARAELITLADYKGEVLASAAERWAHVLTDAGHSLYATLFALQSIEAIRIIEGR